MTYLYRLNEEATNYLDKFGAVKVDLDREILFLRKMK